jgi:hypothetical protein
MDLESSRDSMTLSWLDVFPVTNRGALLSTLLQDILHSSHHLLNVRVLLQIANKLGISNKKSLLLVGTVTLDLQLWTLEFE